jgi:osmotically-inducible protein OsmY
MLPIRHRRPEDRSGHLPDREVKRTIVSRLRENPYTQDARIKVTVHHGTVRLEGDVPSQVVRLAAVQDVEAVPGVSDLDVGLTIAA